MKRLGLVLVGAALALGGMALTVWIFGVLAISSPFSLATWKAHGPLVIYTSEVFSFAPVALLLGVILWRLFSSRRVLDAFLSVMLALLVSSVGALDDPRAALGVLVEMPQFWATFLLGVPGVVYILERLRSNYRLERP
jgi:hypothetical protein